MLRRFFQERERSTGRPAPRPAATPSDRRLYAIGDIHGRLDLLTALHGAVLADHEGRPRDGRDIVIHLGDYVDRGPHSREVIDYLVSGPLPGLSMVHLLGNHDDAMLRFLEDAAAGPTWARYGGDSTLVSYGVRARSDMIGAGRFQDMHRQFVRAVPEAHVAFLRDLRLSFEAGDYFFAHAGVRPGVPLDRQEADDLLWIRDPFLTSDADHGKVVVHGHTPRAEAEIRPNRIGIDTGAFASGVLCCLVLDGEHRRLLSTAVAPSAWQAAE